MPSAIIVAAGQGLRMGGSIRKPYLPLGGVPILKRTLTVFTQSGLFEEIILVVAAAETAFCRQQIAHGLATSSTLQVIAGGRDRQESVFLGLAASRGQADDVVLIHDGVRPFVSAKVLSQCLEAAMAYGACLTAVAAYDTLKQTGDDGRIVQTLPRDAVWMAQTPQGFRLGLIRDAHRQARDEGFKGTDDGQLVERLGQAVTIVPGSRLNIKITTPEDLQLAEAIWRHARSAPGSD
jgi:2-C-methyl-D-erythritol 4-phosphate cytidylyltransferase